MREGAPGPPRPAPNQSQADRSRAEFPFRAINLSNSEINSRKLPVSMPSERERRSFAELAGPVRARSDSVAWRAPPPTLAVVAVQMILSCASTGRGPLICL